MSATLLLRYLIRFGLVVLGFALTTYGILEWHDRRFSLSGVWPLDGGFQLHPLHLLVIGLAMIPPAIWEIFLLDVRHGTDAGTAATGTEEARHGPR